MENRKIFDVFISYSRSDKSVVLPLVHRLEESIGERIWMDLDGIESGSQFEECIVNAIDNCKVLLFMYSSSSLASEWTKREILYAEHEGKHIVPILLDSNSLHGWFRFHFGNIDFILAQNKEHIDKLIYNLCSWLEIAPLVSYNNDALNYLCQYIDHDKMGLKSVLDRHVYVTPKYDYIQNFHDSMALVYKDGKFGYIDKIGNEVVPCIYSAAQPFHEGIAWVGRTIGKETWRTFVFDINEYGAINKKGEILIPFKKYKYIPGPFYEGMSAVYGDNERWGFVDKKGKIVIPCQYNNGNIERNHESPRFYPFGWAILLNDDKTRYFVIDKEGTILVDFERGAMELYTHGEGMIGYKGSSGSGFINIMEQKIAIQAIYKYIHEFSEGLASVYKEWDKGGYINKDGKVVIPFVYQEVSPFHEGMAWVKQNDKYGAIDKTGKMIVPCQFNAIHYFKGGMADVNVGGATEHQKWGIIDKKGNMVIPCAYEYIGKRIFDKLFWVKKAGKYGAVDRNNNVVIPFVYEQTPNCPDTDDYLFYVQKGEENYAIDMWGNSKRIRIINKNGGV